MSDFLEELEEDSWEEDEEVFFSATATAGSKASFTGHEKQITQLNRLISTSHLPHALMFCGEQGIGKYTLAEALAHSLLNSRKEITFEESAILKRMRAGSHSDYLYISGEDNEKSKLNHISVEQVRRIGEFLNKTPGEAPMHVIIIDGAETMNTNASNALLKNLEEPPANTLIILVSHNSANLLPTIRSRVQMVKFSPLTSEQCEQVIKSDMQVTDGVSKEDIALIAELADGRPGLALQWLGHGAVDIYRRWLEVVDGPLDEVRELNRVVEFSEELTADRQSIHMNMEMFAALLLLYVKRAALSEKISDSQEKQAIEHWRLHADVKSIISSWFLLKDQLSLVQKLHLDYKNTLITLLLRLVRGQEPLELTIT